MSARRILDRTVTPEWMSLALGFARSEDDPARARELLDLSLRDDVKSKTGRKKTVTVLTRSWLIPDPDAATVVEWGIEHAGGDLRPWHLGVLLANYPFFADACAAIGRQLSLGDSVSLSELRRTLKRRWGDREVVDVASRGVVRTLVLFEALASTEDESMSEPGKRIPVNEDLLPWLVHALLVAHDEMEMDTRTAASAPEFFMFDMPPRIPRGYPHLEEFAEGGGRVVVRQVVLHPQPQPASKQLELGVD